MQLFKHSRKLNAKKITGQGMSEYLIIVGLLAVAGIAVMGLMGNTVRNQFASMSQELAGSDGTTAMGQAGTDADASAVAANARKGLSNYAGQQTVISQ